MPRTKPKLWELLALLKRLNACQSSREADGVVCDLTDPAYVIELEVLLMKEDARG